MADIYRKLFGGYMPAATTSIYTASIGKRVVLKSMTVCNTSSTAQSFHIHINGVPFVWLRAIKPYETLIIPVFDQVLTAGQDIRVSAKTANTIYMRLSGYDTDRMDLVASRITMTTSDVNVLSNSAKNLLIKSIAITTQAQEPISFYMRLGNDYIIYNKALNPLDTLYIPALDQILIPGEQMYCRVSNTNTSVVAHINAQVVS